MKARKIFLFATCVILCILFAACNKNNVPTPTETKSFAQEKIEEAGFRTAKSDNALPTMESIPEDARRLANNHLSMVTYLVQFGIGTWDDEYKLYDSLDAHPEYIPQIALMINDIRDRIDGNLSNLTPGMTAELMAFGKSNGLWP